LIQPAYKFRQFFLRQLIDACGGDSAAAGREPAVERGWRRIAS